MADTRQKSESTKSEEVKIFFPDSIKGGVFSNNVFINHTSEEFILDFLVLAPRAGSVVARVLMTPSQAKRLAEALTGNLKKYEEKYGKMSDKVKEKK